MRPTPSAGNLCGSTQIVKFLLLCAILFLNSLPISADQPVDVFRFREAIRIHVGMDVTSAIAIGSPVYVDGTIRENAISIGSDIIIRPGGVVEGDAIAIGGRVRQSPGSHVGGKITSVRFSMGRLRRALAVFVPALMAGMGVITGAAIVLGSLGSVALAALVLVLFPGQTAAARRQIDLHPWKTLSLGFLTLFMALPILIFLVITLIGIPLAFVVAALLMSALVLGIVAFGQWVGMRLSRVLGRPLPPRTAGFLGLLILTCLAALPLVGIFLQGGMVCMSLGSVAFSRFRSVRGQESVLL